MGTEAAGPGSGSGSGNNDTGGGIADDVAPVRRLSLPPGLSLRSCTPEDVPHLVDVYINAFSGGDFAYWWGSVPAMRTWNMERFLRRFRDPREAMFKIVANEASEESGKADDKGGEKGGERIVAHTRWVLPEGIKGSGLREERDFGGSGEGRQDVQEDKERKGDEHPDVPDGVDVELYREFFDGLTRAGEKWKANEKLGRYTIQHTPASVATARKGIHSFTTHLSIDSTNWLTKKSQSRTVPPIHGPGISRARDRGGSCAGRIGGRGCRGYRVFSGRAAARRAVVHAPRLRGRRSHRLPARAGLHGTEPVHVRHGSEAEREAG